MCTCIKYVTKPQYIRRTGDKRKVCSICHHRGGKEKNLSVLKYLGIFRHVFGGGMCSDLHTMKHWSW